MRLIDADKVIVTRYDYEKALTLKERLHRLLNNQPTVKAITIDWIRDYMLRLSDGSEAYECILVMLEEWEKENERP